MLPLTFNKKTKRLIIRFFNESDYHIWKETFLNLPPSRNPWDRGPKDPKDLTKIKFKKILANQNKNIKKDIFYDFPAFHRKTSELIGFVSLMDVSRAIFQNAFLGYRVHSPFWRMGYGKEMVHASFEIAFKELKLHRIEAGIEPRNRRSIALAKSLGMRREGLSKRRLFLNDKWLDMTIFAMTSEEAGLNNLKGNTEQILNRV